MLTWKVTPTSVRSAVPPWMQRASVPGGIPGITSGFRTTRGMDWEHEKAVTDTAAKEGAAGTRACVCVLPPVFYAVLGIYISVVRIDCTE